MKATRVVAVAALTLGTIWALRVAQAQTGFKRTELQRHDLGVQGREVVQARAEFDAGGSSGKHTHPGEEIAYLLEGSLEVQMEGKPPMTIKAGEVFFVPAGTVHAARNAGSGTAKVLATYVVEK